MKKIAVTIINIYQAVISTSLKNLLGISRSCRFSVTCSEYAKQSILQKGFVIGSYLSVVRVLKCQPFYKGN
jgi:putative membrane protein insertion efficiency factor